MGTKQELRKLQGIEQLHMAALGRINAALDTSLSFQADTCRPVTIPTIDICQEGNS